MGSIFDTAGRKHLSLLSVAAFWCGLGAWGLVLAAAVSNALVHAITNEAVSTLDERLIDAFLTLSLVPVLPAIGLGIAGVIATRATGGMRGRGFAVAGLVLGVIYLTVLLWLLYVIANVPVD